MEVALFCCALSTGIAAYKNSAVPCSGCFLEHVLALLGIVWDEPCHRRVTWRVEKVRAPEEGSTSCSSPCSTPCALTPPGCAQVPYYDYALDLILDADSPNNEILTEEQHELVESAAEMLYGLVHVRYILTSRGMGAMFEKFKSCEFGRCPRVHCNGQACLPIGTSDVPRQATVKIFCPKCCDIYYPRSKYQACPAAAPSLSPRAACWRLPGSKHLLRVE